MARFVDFVQSNVGDIFLKKVKKSILPDTYMKMTFDNFRSLYDKDNDLIDDGAFPGTIEKYSDLENATDQYYGELPVKNFSPLTSPFVEYNE